MYQALQLFAQLYDEFDHYWQIEMDVRYTGNVRHYLDALSEFARQEPQKQSVERASYFYMQQVHGTYLDFQNTINASLEGAGIWGAVCIPDFEPIGIPPPTPRPEDDDFSWGVGFDADLIFRDLAATCLCWMGGSIKIGSGVQRWRCHPSTHLASCHQPHFLESFKRSACIARTKWHENSI